MPTTRILQLTDLHVFADPQATLKGIPTRTTLQDVVDYVQQQRLEFDHLVVTGDHTHDELPASYQSVRTALTPWLDKLWQIPGNHDDRAVLRSVFADRIAGIDAERINFVLNCAGWTCIGLDSHVPGEVPGRLGDDQLRWLRQTVSASDSPQLALFIHHPPVDVGSVWMDRIGLQDAFELQQLLQQEPRIRLVCCGHVHHEFQTSCGNAEIVTTPATGIQFDPAGTEPNFTAAAPGFRLIELSDTGCLTRVQRLPEIRYTPVCE